MKILGVDISKAKFDMVLMDAERLLFQDERKYQHKVFKNTQQGYIELVEWLMDQNVYELHACMEATSTYGDALAEYLYCCGYKVSMVNPSQVTNFRKSELVRTKTDRNDASVIARFCWSVNPSPWKPLSMENRKLKALTNRLKELETMRQQEKNRLKTPGLDPDVAASIEKHIDILDNEVKDILRRMKNHTSANEEMQMIVERITSIPGVGEKTAMSLLGIIGDFGRFESGRQLAAWAGLTPFDKQSGSSLNGRSYVSKMGRSDVRRLLYMPALSAMQCNPVIKKLARRLKTKNKHGKQIVTAAMHKLLKIVFGVVKNECMFDPNFYPQSH